MFYKKKKVIYELIYNKNFYLDICEYRDQCVSNNLLNRD